MDTYRKDARFHIAIHSLVWVLLVVVPYVSTDQVFELLDPAGKISYALFCMLLSAILLTIFYLNFLYLIPRFLLRERYGRYAVCLLLAITAVLLASAGLFVYFFPVLGLGRQGDPILEKLIPVIIINAISLWFLSLVCSILWLGHDRLKQTEKQRLSAQIASLRSQINPHFLFNSLNNIYAITLDTAPRAAEMLDKLSELMRYTMKDLQQDSVWLEDEVNYISNYIDLQRLRLNRRVYLDYRTLTEIPSVHIAPMLLIPFIENAFKHGVNPEHKSRIAIEMTVSKTGFQLVVLNTKVPNQHDMSLPSGLGIANTRERLELIYSGRHLLVINDSKKEFFVSLHIYLS